MKKLAIDLKDANFITILSDASNHNSTKLYPIVVRYFSFKTGVQIKILNFESIDGETSELLTSKICTVLLKHQLENKIIALSADNTNTNFGGLKRKGENNVHKKLMNHFKRPIIGLGCNAHITNNAINTAAATMKIDIEVIIPKIYLYFHRFTVREANLKLFPMI